MLFSYKLYLHDPVLQDPTPQAIVPLSLTAAFEFRHGSKILPYAAMTLLRHLAYGKPFSDQLGRSNVCKGPASSSFASLKNDFDMFA